MANFVWTGNVNGDIGNPKNWHNADTNAAATRTPGATIDDNDDIWFVKSTTANKSLYGTITGGINNCIFLATAVTNYTIGSVAGYDGISGQWEVACSITCDDLSVGFNPSAGFANTNNGFTADRVTFKSGSVMTTATDAWCLSGTYEGTIKAGRHIYLGNTQLATFNGSNGTFTLLNTSSGDVSILYGLSGQTTSVSTLNLNYGTGANAATVNNQSSTVKAKTVSLSAKTSYIINTIPLEDGGTIRTNGSSIEMLATVGGSQKEWVMPTNGRHEAISASPGSGGLGEISATRVEYKSGTVFSAGAPHRWVVSDVDSSGNLVSNTTASDYAAFFAGTMELNNASYCYVSTAGTSSQFANVYMKASSTEEPNCAPGILAGNGKLAINNDSGVHLIGPLVLSATDTLFVGKLNADLRAVNAYGSHHLKEFTHQTNNSLKFIYSGAVAAPSFLTVNSDIDIASTPLVINVNEQTATWTFSSGSTYTFGDVTCEQSGKLIINSNNTIEIQGNLTINGGTFKTNETFSFTGSNTKSISCTANGEDVPTFNIGTGKTINYDWNSASDTFPNLAITGTLKVNGTTTGANTLSGSGTFNWNSGNLGDANLLFYITSATGTPISVSTISNANYNASAGYRTTFRFECRQNGSYTITLPAAISGDVELGTSVGTSLSLNNSPIYVCPATCAITGNLKIDFSEAINASTYNAKVNVESAAHELQVTGNVTIGARGICSSQLKIIDGNFENKSKYNGNKLTLNSTGAATYTANLGTTITPDILIDGAGLTSKYELSGTATLTGTYTITDATIELQDNTKTTCQSITVTGASACTPNHHLFELSGGGSISDSSTESRTVAGITYLGCESLGAINLTAGNTAIVGSVIVDSIICAGGSVAQDSATAKKLWIRGGTHPTALNNTHPGYKGNANFSNVAINCKTGTFNFPTSGNNFSGSDTLVVGNSNSAEVHIYGNGALNLGVSTNADFTTNTIVKWNSKQGITWGPQSTYGGSFLITRCNIEGTEDMSVPLVSSYAGNMHQGVAKTFTITKNRLHSETKTMALVYVDDVQYHTLICDYNRFKAPTSAAVIKTKYNANATSSTSSFSYNHIRSLSTSGILCELGNVLWHKSYLKYNTFTSDTMTSGSGLLFMPRIDQDYYPNTVLVNPGVIPIDFTSNFAGGTAELTNWYFDTANANFGKSCQGSSTKAIQSRFTNSEPDYVVAGHLNERDPFLQQYESFENWMQVGNTTVVSSIEQLGVVYRYARSGTQTLKSKDIYVNGTVLTATWTDFDSSNKVSVSAKYYDGSATTSETLTSGTALTVPASCIRLHFEVIMSQSEGFANFKVVDNKSRKVFVDSQSADVGTQTTARHEVGPVYNKFAYGGANIGNAVSLIPHVNAQYNDPINQEIWLYINRVSLQNQERYVVLLNQTDANNFYRITAESVSTNNDVLKIEKRVSGTYTTIATKTDCNFTAGDSGTQILMKVGYNTVTNKVSVYVSGTTTTNWSFSLDGTDTTFTTGNWGFATDGGAIEALAVYDGIRADATNAGQIFVNGVDLIFMPDSSWEFGASFINNVEMRNVDVNGNQLSLLPELYGDHSTSVNNVTFVSTVLPTAISRLLVIKDAKLSVAGDVTLTGNGKLFLIGCAITPSVERWKINYSGITYTDSSPLTLQGNMLKGMYSTCTPKGQNAFIVDDNTKNTSIARVATEKVMNVTRNAILGLNYERMIFNGYDSRTVTLTIQSVNDAGIIGKFEEFFMNQTTVELITTYCYLWKAKVVAFTKRYLNNQGSALQATVTLEEWRDD